MLGPGSERSLKCPGEGPEPVAGLCGSGSSGRGLYWRSKVGERGGLPRKPVRISRSLGPTSSHTARAVLPGDFAAQTERHVGTGMERM